MQSDSEPENQAERPLVPADSSAATPAARRARLPAMPQPAEPSERAPTPAGRASGRPLDENVDAAILDATWRLLLRDGYARMSIARVAELIKAKVPLRIGTDNISDVFVPQGDGDMLTEI